MRLTTDVFELTRTMCPWVRVGTTNKSNTHIGRTMLLHNVFVQVTAPRGTFVVRCPAGDFYVSDSGTAYQATLPPDNELLRYAKKSDPGFARQLLNDDRFEGLKFNFDDMESYGDFVVQNGHGVSLEYLYRTWKGPELPGLQVVPAQ